MKFPVVPHIVKINGLWCAVLGSVSNQEAKPMIVFKSLDRKNVEAFIKYSWNGESTF